MENITVSKVEIKICFYFSQEHSSGIAFLEKRGTRLSCLSSLPAQSPILHVSWAWLQ